MFPGKADAYSDRAVTSSSYDLGSQSIDLSSYAIYFTERCGNPTIHKPAFIGVKKLPVCLLGVSSIILFFSRTECIRLA